MAGSAYTYGYATLGEFIAWIIGWDLILEYAVGAITVAIGWSGYVVSFLHDFGIHIPPALSAARGTDLIRTFPALAELLKAKAGWVVSSARSARSNQGRWNRSRDAGQVTAIFNLPAVLHHLCRHDAAGRRHQGIGELQQHHRAGEGLGRVALYCRSGACHYPANWHPFIPANTGSRAISAGAA